MSAPAARLFGEHFLHSLTTAEQDMVDRVRGLGHLPHARA
jgi:hypothetical protein